MANAERPSCSKCKYSTGTGDIIICNNPTHFGLAMRATDVCDYFEMDRPPIKRSVSDTIRGKDAGG